MKRTILIGLFLVLSIGLFSQPKIRLDRIEDITAARVKSNGVEAKMVLTSTNSSSSTWAFPSWDDLDDKPFIPVSIWDLTNISATGFSEGSVLKFNTLGQLVVGTDNVGEVGAGITLADLSALSPITYNNTTGAFGVSSGYTVPTTTEKTNYDAAFGWGDHATGGYVNYILTNGIGDEINLNGYINFLPLDNVTINTSGSNVSISVPGVSWDEAYTNMGKSNVDGVYGLFPETMWEVSGGYVYPKIDLTPVDGGAHIVVSDNLYEAMQTKQDNLVSGTSIKTVNGNSLLGSGNITIDSGGTEMIYPGAGIPLSTGSAWGTSITDNSANWDEAHGWGDHSLAGYINSDTKWDGGSTGLNTETAKTSLGLVIGTDIEPYLGAPTGSTYYLTTNGTSRAWLLTNLKEDALGNPDNDGYLLSSTTTGVRTWVANGSSYTLPQASATVRGGIKTGSTPPAPGYQAVDITTDGFGYVAINKTDIEYALTGAITTHTHNYAAPITGAATTIDTENLTVGRALISDGSGKVGISTVTATELAYVSGVTSSIQTQFSGKAALNGNVANNFYGLTFNVPDWSIENNAGALRFYNASGNMRLTTSGDLTTSGSVTSTESYRTGSDRRLKEHIKPIQSNFAKINLRQFEKKSDSTNRINLGAIAQQVEKTHPELVFTDEYGMKSIAYVEMLVGIVNDLREDNKKLWKEVERLKRKQK